MFKNLLVPLLSAIPILLALLVILRWYPDLFPPHDHNAAFSTVGTLITVYAAIIAVVEIIRARGIAQKIFGEAQKVAGVIGNFHLIQEIVECQDFLGMAICALEDEVPIPPTALTAIIKVYSKLFREEMSNSESVYAECRARLYAYKSSAKGKVLRQNTLVSLRVILGQVSELAGHRSAMVENALIGNKSP